jgi:hypothetical protein
MADKWRWSNMTPQRTADKLAGFIEMRGAIAHRQHSSASIRRNTVTDYGAFIRRLVNITDEVLVRRYNERVW